MIKGQNIDKEAESKSLGIIYSGYRKAAVFNMALDKDIKISYKTGKHIPIHTIVDYRAHIKDTLDFYTSQKDKWATSIYKMFTGRKEAAHKDICEWIENMLNSIGATKDLNPQTISTSDPIFIPTTDKKVQYLRMRLVVLAANMVLEHFTQSRTLIGLLTELRGAKAKWDVIDKHKKRFLNGVAFSEKYTGKHAAYIIEMLENKDNRTALALLFEDCTRTAFAKRVPKNKSKLKIVITDEKGRKILKNITQADLDKYDFKETTEDDASLVLASKYSVYSSTSSLASTPIRRQRFAAKTQDPPVAKKLAFTVGSESGKTEEEAGDITDAQEEEFAISSGATGLTTPVAERVPGYIPGDKKR